MVVVKFTSIHEPFYLGVLWWFRSTYLNPIYPSMESKEIFFVMGSIKTKLFGTYGSGHPSEAQGMSNPEGSASEAGERVGIQME